ncbi:MAG: ribosome small subunit-dependent GTPase A [Alphaproteobacteria bacterium]|nr:ribosome small subunit-dependent GTPase A [Alphaproteobacteria bacterium]
MIELYGWSDALQHDFHVYAARGLEPARVVIQQRGLYRLVTESGEFSAGLSGRFTHEAMQGDYPVAGDWVAADLRPAEQAATIHAVVPRRSAFVRKAVALGGRPQVVAANVDIALLVASLNADLSLRRLERYLAAAWESGASPIVVLTKADLGADVMQAVAAVEGIAIGVPVRAVSAVTGDGMAALAAELGVGRTAVLLGSSGAGKSTLLNALAGADLMATQAIRVHDDRGRHTTTHRELVRLPNGTLLLDTPGMRELGLVDADEGVGAIFADIERLAARCRFSDCSHTAEPGCAIREGLADGSLDAGRWRSYGKLQRELAHEDRKDDHQARQAHRKMWTTRHKAYRAMVRHRDRNE